MQHIVEYEKWCKLCKYGKQDEEEYPCYLCLDEPVKDDGKRPVYYSEDKTNKKKERNNKDARSNRKFL